MPDSGTDHIGLAHTLHYMSCHVMHIMCVQMCRDSSECADNKVCLGHYRHVSNLLYSFSEENKFHCGIIVHVVPSFILNVKFSVDEDVPGEAIFQKFKVLHGSRVSWITWHKTT